LEITDDMEGIPLAEEEKEEEEVVVVVAVVVEEEEGEEGEEEDKLGPAEHNMDMWDKGNLRRLFVRRLLDGVRIYVVSIGLALQERQSEDIEDSNKDSLDLL